MKYVFLLATVFLSISSVGFCSEQEKRIIEIGSDEDMIGFSCHKCQDCSKRFFTEPEYIKLIESPFMVSELTENNDDSSKKLPGTFVDPKGNVFHINDPQATLTYIRYKLSICDFCLDIERQSLNQELKITPKYLDVQGTLMFSKK